jgi:hypothetical protein
MGGQGLGLGLWGAVGSVFLSTGIHGDDAFQDKPEVDIPADSG